MKRTNLIIVSAVTAAVVVGGAATIAVAQDSPGPSPDDLRAAGEAASGAVDGGEVVSVERDDDGGYEVDVRRADGSEVDVDLSATLEVLRTEDEHDDVDDTDDDRNETDDVAPADVDLGRASQAALEAVGDGSVTDAEWDDGGYDVEVRGADGRQLDVRLDQAFGVVQRGEDTDD